MNARLWRKLRADRRAMLGLGAIAALVLLALLAPVVSRWSPTSIALANQLQPPSAAHWLGTDLQGRDVWARLIYGARISLSVGFLSQGISLTIGLTLGLIAGFYGKWVDEA